MPLPYSAADGIPAVRHFHTSRGRQRGGDVEKGASPRSTSYLNGEPDRAISHYYPNDSATLDRKSRSAAPTRQVTMEVRVRFEPRTLVGYDKSASPIARSAAASR
jgi:hypothetical protein